MLLPIIGWSQTVDMIPPTFKSKVPVCDAYYIAPKVNNLIESEKALAERQEFHEKMWRFGKEIAVNLPFFENAQQFLQPNGDVIYQFGIKMKTAKSVNLILNDFHLANGATLFVTDAKRPNILEHTLHQTTMKHEF